jgi:uncharacterized membrane-anchored protein
MMLMPPDHPQRLALADEVHARPSEPVARPSRAGYVALLVDGDARSAELAHLARLAATHGVAGPAAGDTQWRGTLGQLLVRWERHGEFSSLMFLLPGVAEAPGLPPPWESLPAGWFERLPGQTIVAVRAAVLDGRNVAPDSETLADHFAGHTLVGARLGNGLATAYTDFRLRADQCVRMLLVDSGMSEAQTGRMLQRLFEIEAYRMLALLALPIARRQSPRIVAIESALARLTDGIAREDGREETLLHELTRLAAEVESGLAAGRFRFGACRAYNELVRTRIAELREQRIEGLQTIEEFMARRFAPAVATCLNVEQRLQDLSERVAQASSLLATRVGIARERQNQQLLVSMERRARQQLRLQQTVEGLSIAAILYYLAGLIGQGARGLKALGLAVEPDLIVAVAIVPLAAVLWWGLKRARARVATAEPVAAD